VVRSLIKTARNGCAEVVAELLFRMPALEPVYRACAAPARHVPGVHTFFRETTDRLIRRLVDGDQQVRRVRIGPVTARLDVSHFTVAGCYFAGVMYEPGATAAMCAVLKPGSVFVDVGANTGYFSVLAGLLVGPLGRVVAFEPNPDVRARLERHLELNGLTDRVVVSDAALGSREQNDARFYISCCDSNDGLSSLSRSAVGFGSGALRTEITTSVRVRTFDAVAEQLGLGRIDLMKVDVEGGEYDVFAGMSRTLAACPPSRIICETPPDSDTARVLAGYGYCVRVADDVPGGTPNLLFERKHA
jgi:FkbM family methyltransferase